MVDIDHLSSYPGRYKKASGFCAKTSSSYLLFFVCRTIQEGERVLRKDILALILPLIFPPSFTERFKKANGFWVKTSSSYPLTFAGQFKKANEDDLDLMHLLILPYFPSLLYRTIQEGERVLRENVLDPFIPFFLRRTIQEGERVLREDFDLRKADLRELKRLQKMEQKQRQELALKSLTAR